MSKNALQNWSETLEREVDGVGIKPYSQIETWIEPTPRFKVVWNG